MKSKIIITKMTSLFFKIPLPLNFHSLLGSNMTFVNFGVQ